MTPTPSAEQKGAGALLFWWLAPIAIVLFGLAVWSNHFQNGFHGEDYTTIVNNRAVRSLSNVPLFFTRPRTFSTEPENADYRPWLLSSFAFDASVTRSNGPLIYQIDSFVWFGLLMVSLYVVFRLIPGTDAGVALFGAALFGLHPIAAETVNYVVQRGQIMGAAGVCMALALWIFWSHRLPLRLGLNLDRVPQTSWQSLIRNHGPKLERAYRDFRKISIPFYLIPLIPALLAEPSAAVFALLALAFTYLYDSETGYRRLALPAIICGGYWFAQTALVWTVSPLFRIPFVAWWSTQPLVAMRYLYTFVAPFGLSADSGFRPVTSPLQPLPIAGFLGLSVLVGCAVLAGRRDRWRGVAFGLWWFLIGLAPTALVPQRTAEANPRMFLAAAGLAFAVAHLCGIWISWVRSTVTGKAGATLALGVSAVIALLVPGGLGWMTYERNRVWENERTLWLDVTRKSPGNGRGYIQYATALLDAGEDSEYLVYLQKAVPFSGDDSVLQLRLAQGYDRLNKDDQAESHFRRALLLAPGYAAAHSIFSQWLFSHQRWNDAFDMATRALALNPADLIARHTLMDLYSAKSDWRMVNKLAKETLELDPDDDPAKRSLVISATSLDQLRKVEAEVKNSPDADVYLKVSVLYFNSQRYEESIRAAQQALRLRPNLAEAYANMASALHAMGRDAEAVTALREVVRLRPDLTFAKTDLEILLEKAGAR
ncbi:MAG: protein O-mannosyl-transferase [Bryobacterales bacterium]|nr:protein O-mannosyl-transferase [Bryobacterales bacterium]